MFAEPQKEHEWLQKFVGEWTFESECVAEPDKPTWKCTGTDSVQSIGGLWVMCEGRSQLPDGKPAITFMTLGYDPARKRYVGTFIGSMMTHLWLYDGGLDGEARVLTLDTEGPSFTAPGKLARYQDVIEFKSNDHRVLTSRFLSEDGKWHEFMTAHYRRIK